MNHYNDVFYKIVFRNQSRPTIYNDIMYHPDTLCYNVIYLHFYIPYIHYIVILWM